MKIGVVITTYNRKRFSEECLKSFVWSKPKNTIACIVDNASTDGTREMLQDFLYEGSPIHSVILNSENKHLGYAMSQAWFMLAGLGCDILSGINNDFLIEPGCEQNVLSCLTELDLDYVVGTVRPDREDMRKTTPSGEGHYTTINDVGAAYFLRTKHFLNGIAPSIKPFSTNYVGPGPSFHNLLRRNELKGVRLAHPGVLVRDSEYTNPDLVEYYDETFGVRDIESKLSKWRDLEKKGKHRGWINWGNFLKKHYPDKT